MGRQIDVHGGTRPHRHRLWTALRRCTPYGLTDPRASVSRILAGLRR